MDGIISEKTVMCFISEIPEWLLKYGIFEVFGCIFESPKWLSLYQFSSR